MGSSRNSGHKSKSSKHRKSKLRKSTSSNPHRKSEKRKSKDVKHRSKRKRKYSTSSSSSSGSESEVSDSRHTRIGNKSRHSHTEQSDESDPDELRDTTGPALPPHLRMKRRQDALAAGPEDNSRQLKRSSEEGSRDTDVVLPIGPSLPEASAGLHRTTEGSHSSSSKKISTEHSQTTVQKPVCGPAMPPQGVDLHRDFALVQAGLSDDDFVGPAVPTTAYKSSDDTLEDKLRIIEERMRKTKDQLNNKGKEGDDAPVREAWMMELPPEHSLSIASNLTARTFATKTPNGGDRSGWTDTPQAIAERRQKAMERIQNGTQDNVNARQDKTKSLRLPGQTAREREMAAMVQEYNATSRVKSLMEMHGEKSQKAVAELQETKMKGGKGFDRDRDMNLRQVDDKKFRELTSAPGKGLTSMFGSGESRFL